MGTERSPSYSILPDASEEERALVTPIIEGLRSDPEYYLRALGVAAMDEEIVVRVLDFVEDNPEGGTKTVRDLIALLDTGADVHLDFDKATNQAIRDDERIKSIRNDRNTPDRVKSKRTRIRRLQIFGERTRAA